MHFNRNQHSIGHCAAKAKLAARGIRSPRPYCAVGLEYDRAACAAQSEITSGAAATESCEAKSNTTTLT